MGRSTEELEGSGLMPKAPPIIGRVGPLLPSAPVTAQHAIAAFSALGQPTRLEILRLLMRHEPDGLPAGNLAETIGCPQNTLSSHLGILARAGLIQGRRDRRSIVYRAEVGAIRALMEFMMTDCCNGHPEICDLRASLRERSACAPANRQSRPGRSGARRI
jgi:DNA-binding transcriptional ArsR family regulator